ncbi:MAG: glycoside hydrolase domain-containing protein [Kiritimatiellia bacterium]
MGLASWAEEAKTATPAAAVALDANSLWRYFVVNRCSYVRTGEGKLEPRAIGWYWGGIKSTPVTNVFFSPPPPAQWTATEFDDTAWPRVRIPQPVLTVSGANPRPFYKPYDKAIVYLRGKFGIEDPTRVIGCRLSVDYWGGVIVCVNGKEVTRADIANDNSVQEMIATDYPLEAFVTAEGTPLRARDGANKNRLAMRTRRISDFVIPREVLRKGKNVLAVMACQAPVPEVVAKGVGQNLSDCGWPPVGIIRVTLVVEPQQVATTTASRPAGIQVWNCAGYETITAFDYGDPLEPLRPVEIFAARNGVFSGRLVVSSDQPIRGLSLQVNELSEKRGGAKLPASVVETLYAPPAEPAKSWVPPYRFDALLRTIPHEIGVYNGAVPREGSYSEAVDRLGIPRGAVAPLWLRVRIPKDAIPGTYEGNVRVAAEGLAPVVVPLILHVSSWTVPDPKELRVHNFAYISDEALAQHYGVPRWSDKHFDLIAKSLSLMAEVGSRQVFLNLAIDFYGVGSNPESVVRWIKQPNGTYRHDFTVFDRYLDVIAKSVGKPLPMRLNCWGEVDKEGRNTSAKAVSLLDPAAGNVEPLEQPPFGTEASFLFWQPVFEQMLKKIEARGWLDVTALGHNSYCWHPKPEVVDVAHKLWPEGVWAYTAHNGGLGMSFRGTDKGLSMPVRYADTVWGAGKLSARGYRALLKSRPGFWCFTYRGCFGDGSPLVDLSRIAEDEISSGHDGISDFGVDLFPLPKRGGGYYRIASLTVEGRVDQDAVPWLCLRLVRMVQWKVNGLKCFGKGSNWLKLFSSSNARWKKRK